MFSKFSQYRRGLIPISNTLHVVAPNLTRATQGQRQVEFNTLTGFWNSAWRRYELNCPDAQRIHQILRDHGEENIIVDHVALRTFDFPNINKERVGSLFSNQGYVKVPETLVFQDKHLVADYYIHPDENQPKIFISELKVEQISKPIAEILRGTTRHTRLESLKDLLQPTWQPIKFSVFKNLRQVSEYAAWTAAFGIQVNHFALLANKLKTYCDLIELNRLLQQNEIEFNQPLIKGKKENLLLQSSTQASLITHSFADSYEKIPGCFYEFVQRFQLADGQNLYQGFQVDNANQIFDSTTEKQN